SRHLALGGQKGGESLVEIGAVAVEADGHGGFLGGFSAYCSMARPGWCRQPLADVSSVALANAGAHNHRLWQCRPPPQIGTSRGMVPALGGATR
ncbi:MAG: hypothetical protein ACRC1G_14205, partial [Bradyrhizobium sp.]